MKIRINGTILSGDGPLFESAASRLLAAADRQILWDCSFETPAGQEIILASPAEHEQPYIIKVADPIGFITNNLHCMELFCAA